MRFLGFVFAVAAMLAATKASAAPEEIEFSDLADPLAVVFDDPYRDMGFQLLNELKLILQVDERLSQDDLAEDERARLEARRTAAKDMLEINGYDIDELIAQRWEVAKKRKAALMATNPALDKVEVTLSGYLIPAPQAPDGTYYGYLVSQVGMCSHLPPPPPNELVRVKVERRSAGPVSLCAGSSLGPAACRSKRCHHIHPRWRVAYVQRLDPGCQHRRSKGRFAR